VSGVRAVGTGATHRAVAFGFGVNRSASRASASGETIPTSRAPTLA
jgi:hypothetical protein